MENKCAVWCETCHQLVKLAGDNVLECGHKYTPDHAIIWYIEVAGFKVAVFGVGSAKRYDFRGLFFLVI